MSLRIASRINDWVVNRPVWVIAAFLVVTLIMAGGLTNISTETGTDQFTENIPAYKAQEKIDREFSPVFAEDNESTSLIQQGSNVLSKPDLTSMLKIQRRLKERPDLRVVKTSSAASMVARSLDRNATSLTDQLTAVKTATPTEIDRAVRKASKNPGFESQVSKDFNAEDGSASYTVASLQHSLSGNVDDQIKSIQVEIESIVNAVDTSFTVFGEGVLQEELKNVISDSLAIVIPAVVILILFFLIVAYRDPFDLVFGLISLFIAIIWTFGFMGWAGISFTQMLISVPPLLLSVGIDFGIHNINRYREERVQDKGIEESMRITLRQLLVAFFIAAGTTALGFLANLTSGLAPIRTFGIVAAIGIIFTAVIFSLFLPALKIYSDRLREDLPVPEFGTQPMGSSDSVMSGFLTSGNKIGKKAPYIFLVLMAVLTLTGGYYATGIDTSFSQNDFLPPEKQPGYVKYLPASLQPHDYSITAVTNLIKDKFESGSNDRVTVLTKGPLTENYGLDQIHGAGKDPPSSFLRNDDFNAKSTSVVTYIKAYERQSRGYGELVERSDLNGNGVPDVNMNLVFDELLRSSYGDEAENYVTSDKRDARIVYQVKSDASQDEVSADARKLTSRFPFHAIATGQIVIFQAVSDLILSSAIKSMLVAIGLTLFFLILVYRLLHGRWSLGVVNIVPIMVTLALLLGTMRFFDIPFNAMTATILSVTIGIGVDYSVHVIDRFATEYRESGDVYESLEVTMLGTGGALTGSMLTTAVGNGTLVLAITPVLGQFGVLLFISVFFGYLTSIVVVPPTLVVWSRFTGGF
ncbi:MAG: RND family transporter [Halobacteria archaeon]